MKRKILNFNNNTLKNELNLFNGCLVKDLITKKKGIISNGEIIINNNLVNLNHKDLIIESGIICDSMFKKITIDNDNIYMINKSI